MSAKDLATRDHLRRRACAVVTSARKTGDITELAVGLTLMAVATNHIRSGDVPRYAEWLIGYLHDPDRRLVVLHLLDTGGVPEVVN
jgi:hypothetical protein